MFYRPRMLFLGVVLVLGCGRLQANERQTPGAVPTHEAFSGLDSLLRGNSIV